MKKLLVSLLSVVPVLASAATSTWNVDASHSQVGFSVKHLVISNVRGEFGAYQGKLALDESEPAKSTVEATIDVNSIDTKVADRDAHLKSRRLLRRREVPEHHLQVDEGRQGGQGQAEGHGRSHPARGDEAGGPRRLHLARGEGHVRRDPPRVRGDHEDQPQGLRAHLEQARRGRPGRRRRGDDRARRSRS